MTRERLDATIAAGLRDGLPPPGPAETELALRAVRARRPARVPGSRLRVLAAAAAVVAAAAAPLALGLGGDRSAEDPVVEPAPRPDRPAQLLAGTFERVLARGPERDWAGSWTMTLRAEGVLQLDPPRGVRVASVDGIAWTASGDRLRTDALVNGVCGDHPPGTYRWSLGGGTLRLQALSDTCDARVQLLTGSWSRRQNDA